MKYSVSYITVVIELMKSKDVFGANLKLESPFSIVAMTSYGLRAFFIALKISGSNRFFPDCLKRSIENDEVTKIQSRVFKGRTGRNAKHSISGISERKGDDLTGSIPDHAVVAHSKNNKQYRINDFLSKCFNSYCLTGLVIGDITLYPLKE